MIKDILKNPLSLWAKWLLTKLYLEWTNSSRNLKIGYAANISKCKFGSFNTIYANAVLKNVSLNDFSYVAEGAYLANVTVGKFSSIGPGTMAGLGRHPSRRFVSTHPVFFSEQKQAQITFASDNHFNEFADIHIGNDVWVGARAIILDGINISDGAIIGAGSVVTKDVPAYAIVAGVPARLIRYRFDHPQIAFLMQFRWWDKSTEWLAQNYKSFHDVESLMSQGDHSVPQETEDTLESGHPDQ